MMAEQELRAVLENVPEAATRAHLDKATANLEKARPKQRWKAVLYIAALVAVVIAAIPLTRDYVRLRIASYDLLSMSDPMALALPGPAFRPDVDQQVADLFGPLSRDERLLLFGDLSQPTRTEAMERLWKSSPDDPVLFAAFVRSTYPYSSAPDDFLDTADRLDPENSWYRYLAASFAADGSVESFRLPYRTLKAHPNSPRFGVRDVTAHAEVIRLLEEASRIPGMDSHAEELLLRRLKVLPAGDDVLGRKLTHAYLQMRTPSWSVLGIYLSRSISARAEELAAKGDQDGFRTLAEVWEIFARRSINDRGFDVSLSSAQHLARAARNLGIESLADRYTRIDRAIVERERARGYREAEMENEWGKLQQAAGGILYEKVRVENAPILERSDILPSIMAEQSALQRIASALGAIAMLVVLILSASTRFSRGQQVRRLSASLVKVLDSSDYLRILMAGVALPVLVHLIAEWMIPPVLPLATEDAVLPILLRHAALAAAIITLPALLVAKRMGFLLGRMAWGKPPAIMLATTSIMALAAMVAGFTNIEPLTVAGWAFVSVFPGVVLIYLTFGLAACPRTAAVHYHTWARGISPAYATGLLAFALLVPINHARERHWTKRNVLTKIEPGIPAMNRYLHEIEQIEKKELLEILEAKP
ncbi:hypothetical protein OKA04_07800 [Luteolibacter flavescens]|uniref:Uncharacterized protein n=1 Tax=Luteolibacter flavescens TaxID=1859460 RepID=A0ABT3FMF3_9BACT|nr:hypothetical protein [Luteolibacter flavescens]MCW1884632.1 hypothetical protein [Luteolibacter flavescens]